MPWTIGLPFLCKAKTCALCMVWTSGHLKVHFVHWLVCYADMTVSSSSGKGEVLAANDESGQRGFQRPQVFAIPVAQECVLFKSSSNSELQPKSRLL